MITTTEYLSALALIGREVRATFRSQGKPAAAHKGVTLSKVTTAQILTGVEYRDLPEVRDAIAAGERGEPGSLPWGSWLVAPYVIEHKGETYGRLSIKAFESVTYLVDGMEVTRDEYATFLTPGERARMLDPEAARPAAITVKISNFVSLG